jgi:hypothetical protein
MVRNARPTLRNTCASIRCNLAKRWIIIDFMCSLPQTHSEEIDLIGKWIQSPLTMKREWRIVETNRILPPIAGVRGQNSSEITHRTREIDQSDNTWLLFFHWFFTSKNRGLHRNCQTTPFKFLSPKASSKFTYWKNVEIYSNTFNDSFALH